MVGCELSPQSIVIAPAPSTAPVTVTALPTVSDGDRAVIIGGGTAVIATVVDSSPCVPEAPTSVASMVNRPEGTVAESAT